MKYFQKYSGLKRDFTLREDSLCIDAKFGNGNTSNTVIPYSAIIIDSMGTLHVRPKNFTSYLSSALVSTVLPFFAIFPYQDTGHKIFFLSAIIPIILYVMAFKTRKKIKFYSFGVKEGYAKFDIGENDSPPNEFEEFVKELISRST